MPRSAGAPGTASSVKSTARAPTRRYAYLVPEKLDETGRKPGTFRPGHDPRRNSEGRPRRGLALAECIRRRLDPDKILDLLNRYAADEREPIDKRLATLLPWARLGYLAAPTTIAARVESATTAPSPIDVSALPLAAKRELLAALRSARAALPAGDSADSGADVATSALPAAPAAATPRVGDPADVAVTPDDH